MRWPIVVVLSALLAKAEASDFSARIAVQSDAEVVALFNFGVQVEDAKIRIWTFADGTTKHRVRYNPENGYVTIVGTEEMINRVVQAGYQLLTVSTVSSSSRRAGKSAPSDTIAFQFGWPRTIFNGLSLYENSPTVADIDINGQLDVSVTNAWGSYNPTNPPYLITWRRNGAYLAGFPVPLEPGFLQSSADAGISAAADIFGDEKLELVCGDENGFLYAVDHAGQALAGFPRNFGTFVGVYTPALADVDGDGKAEIAVITHNWDSPYGSAFLHLFKVTATGPVELSGFPISFERGSESSPAVGDLDGDGSLEIVIGTGGIVGSPTAKIIAFTSSGRIVSGFPFVVGANSVGNSPTLFDIDRDGKLEILIRMKPDSMGNGIFAIDHRGQLVPGFPFPVTFGNPGSCVAAGDMDGDNIPELAYGGVESVDSGKVWVYDLKGNLLPGFPARVFRTWVDGSVAIADVDGDGKGDVVCGTNGVSNKPGLICAFNHLGQVIQGFPLSPGNPMLNSFETHPTLADIDGDGDTEIFAGRLDKNVYGWDTPGTFDSTKVWRTFKGNAARTGGQLRSPFAVSVSEARFLPTGFSLSQNYPNPFNPTTTIEVNLPQQSDFTLTIVDVLGREVRSFAFDQASPGVHRIVWDGADATGREAASGIYLYRLKMTKSVFVKKMLLLR